MRAMLTWIAPAVATFAAWWIFFGMDANDNYTVPQAAGLVIVLLAIGVVCGWIARAMDLLPFVVSAVMGISAACWTSWSDDITGMFGVGWIMITAGAALGATVVIVGTWAVRQAVRPSA